MVAFDSLLFSGSGTSLRSSASQLDERLAKAVQTRKEAERLSVRAARAEEDAASAAASVREADAERRRVAAAAAREKEASAAELLREASARRAASRSRRAPTWCRSSRWASASTTCS